MTHGSTRDQGEGHHRGGIDEDQHPSASLERLVGEARHRERRNDHQDDNAQAIGPGCPAEEQPPHDDG
jgi:hypothetical protein